MAAKKFLRFKYLLPVSLGLAFFIMATLGNDILAAFDDFNGVKTIEPDQVPGLVASDDVLLIDVRELEEYEVSHLENAVLLEDLDLDKIDSDKTLLIYCTIGFRSTELGATLREKGFRNIYNLSGGIIRWKNEGRPVYDADHQPTDKVHVYSDLFGFLLREGQAVD